MTSNKVYESTCAAYDYSVNKSLNFFLKATSSIGAQKLGKLALAIFSTLEFYTGNKYLPALSNTISGGVDLIDIGLTGVIGASLLNPLNSKNLDHTELEATLSNALPVNQQHSVASVMEAFKKEAKNISCRPQVVEILTKILLKQGICNTTSDANDILDKVKIQTEPRPILKTTALVLTIFCTAGSSLNALDKFGVLKLASISAALGATKVFGFIAHMALETTLGTVSILCNVVVIVDTTWEMIDAKFSQKRVHDDNSEGEEKIRQGWWILAGEITDLAATALPLAFVSLNPPLILGLGLIAKGVGFAAFCNIDS